MAAVLVACGILSGIAFYYRFTAAAPVNAVESQQAACWLLVFGIGDKQPTTWDGSISLVGGKLAGIQGWRFAGQDATDGRSQWSLSTRYGAAPSPGMPAPLLENGVLVTMLFQEPNPWLIVETLNGGFSFRAQEVSPVHGKTFLNGRVMVRRIACEEPRPERRAPYAG